MQNYFCYHIIAVAAYEKLVEIPTESKNVPISQKRGRKAKARGECHQKNLD